MKKFIIFGLLLSPVLSKSQVVLETSFDPSIATGYSTIGYSGLNYSVNIGYQFKRICFYSSFQEYRHINLKKYSIDSEIIILRKGNFNTTANFGYGVIQRSQQRFYKSYNLGGKIRYHIYYGVNIFASYMADGRPELVGNPDGHLKFKGRFQCVFTTKIGVSINIGILNNAIYRNKRGIYIDS